MQVRTHLAMNERLCGKPVSVSPGAATVELVASQEMVADERGLVHGGFVFGLADYAAMLAINEPTVVLGAAELRFLAPVAVGDVLRAQAQRQGTEGKKHKVDVDVLRVVSTAAPGSGVVEQLVFRGSFVCFVPPNHVLDGKQA